MVHLVRDRGGRRRIAELHVLDRDRGGYVTTVPAALWGPYGFERAEGWQRLRSRCERGGGAV